MRRRRTELQIFSLSMLDVIAGALGAFLIVVILLLPYYQQESVDLVARIRALEAELAHASAAAETAKADARALRMTDLDLVLVMDTTGSMRREIEELKANLDSLVRLLRALTASLRVGFVAYRDLGDAYLTRDLPLTPMDEAGYQRLHAFIATLDASGGGDREEAVHLALEKAVAQPWAEGAHGYIILVGDAPAHEADAPRAYRLAADFSAGSEKRRVSVIALGAGQDFFRQLAEQGRGSYIRNRGELYESLLIAILKRD
jgi:uncharacterized protein YegL